MTTEYKYADDVRAIAEKVVKEVEELNHIDLTKVTFIRTSKHISGDYVLARCNLLNDMVQFLSEKKYVIEIPPIFDTLKDKIKHIVIEHECMHIPADGKGLTPHSIGEFREIIEKYGIDYLNDYKEAEEKIKLLKEKEKLEKKQKKSDEVQ